MKKPEQIRILKALLQQLDDNKTCDAGVQVKNPTSSYVCRELAAKEWRHFFREHPQLIGLSGDLPESGSYFTIDDFGVPVLATRDGDGNFHAFVNACRHRGMQVASEKRGTAKRFVCPFHGWTYTGAGELFAVSQAEDFGALDRECLGLLALPAVERFGMLWVHPQPGGHLDVGALLGELAPEIENWHIGDRILRGESSLDKRLNWKLANDTFGETYHFSRLHRRTLNNLFYGDVLFYEVFGRNHRAVFPSRGIDSLRRKPEEQWHMEGVTSILYYLFPNIQIVIGDRQVTMFRIYPHPDDPGRSVTRVNHYFSAEALNFIASGDKTVIGADNVYDPSARNGNAVISPEASMEILDSTVEQEDYLMGQGAQRTAESGLVEYIIFGRNEAPLHHFHNTFREALDMPPLERFDG